MTHPIDSRQRPVEPISEIDVRAIGAAIRRRRRAIWIPTIVAFVLIGVYVNVATPRYTSEAQILLENQETFFTRPDRVNLPLEQASQVDQEAVASQIQLISSRDLARRAVKALHLRGNPEFDPFASGINPFKRALILVGLAPDPTRDGIERQTVTAFLDRLTVFSPPKTRVISIQFTSRDPELAARGANTVAELYLSEQSASKRATARQAAEALAGQIADLRSKLALADAERERYRVQSGLLTGSNNMTISGQQLADINSDLSKARSAQADAQAKASLIRDLLRAGKSADVPDVLNSDIVRRVSDQRMIAQAQLALESRTLLAGHPRIKELSAQVAQYDIALKNAAKQAAATLENQAKIAGQRVINLEALLKQQKESVGVANVDEVHLRALERTTQGFKDQLESSTTKYQEALARQSSTATPADARIISRASAPQDPSFPKKLPFIIFGTVATFVLAIGYVIASELLSGRATVGGVPEGQRDPAREPETAVAKDRPTPPARRRTEPVKSDALLSITPTTNDVFRRFDVASKLGWRGAKGRMSSGVFAPVGGKVYPTRRLDVASAFSRPSALEREEAAEPPRVGNEGGEQKRRRLSFAKLGTIAPATLLRSAAASFKRFGQSAASSAKSKAMWDNASITDRDAGWTVAEPAAFLEAPLSAKDADSATEVRRGGGDVGDVAWLATRIIAAHVPGRGLRVVGTSIGSDDATRILIDLSRTLAEKGRSIVVDLNRSPAKLASLAGPIQSEGHPAITTMQGLSELLAGAASFAEVIHRDHASRLHFIPTGLQEADFRDFDLILDALSETYDFVVLLTPAFPQSEIAKVMAPYADFVVLTAEADPADETLALLERELIEAGAKDVLVAGISTPGQDHARDVA